MISRLKIAPFFLAVVYLTTKFWLAYLITAAYALFNMYKEAKKDGITIRDIIYS